MSIIPAGNRREQVAQGPLKNQGMLDSVLFNKIAIAPGGLGGEPDKKPNPSNDLQNAMGDSPSKLNMGGDIPGAGSGQSEQPGQFDPMNPNPESSQGVTPAGGTGESPFLQPPDPMEGQVQSNPMLQQMDQIEQVVQGHGFKMKLRERGQGKGTIELLPLRPMQRENYKRILQGLQNLGLDPTGVDLPGEPISNDPVYMEYTSGIGEEKVMKPGKSR